MYAATSNISALIFLPRNVSTAKRNDYITPIDCLGDSVNTTGLHVPTQLGSLSISTNMPLDQTPPAYATIVLPR